MQSRFPVKEYLAPGILLVASTAWFAAQQWLSNQWWWPKMPWGLITVGILLFMMGTVYADLWNKTSQLRRWLKERRRRFEPIVFSRINSDEQKEWFELVARIRFKKRTKDCLIELFAYDCVQFVLTRKPELIRSIDPKDYSKDEAIDVVIACIPHYLKAQEPRRHSLWGNVPGGNILVEGARTIAGQSENLAEIRVGGGLFGLQSFRIFFAMTDGRPDTGGSFYFVPEDRNVSFR